MNDYKPYIMESEDLRDYLTSSDYEIIFYDMLRDFAFDKNPNLSRKINMSYLMKNYLSDFMAHYNIDKSVLRYGSHSNIPSKLGQELYSLGVYELSIYLPEKKFTETYKKFLDWSLSTMKIPKEIIYKFVEETPNNVVINVSVNYEDVVKDNVDSKLFSYLGRTYSSPFHKLTKDLESRLNLKLGNPTEGGINFSISDVKYIGRDEWNKKFLKELRSFVKSSPYLNDKIKAIKLKERDYRIDLDLIFKDPEQYSHWSSRSTNRAVIQNVFDEIKNYIRSKGYNVGGVFNVDSPTWRKNF